MKESFKSIREVFKEVNIISKIEFVSRKDKEKIVREVNQIVKQFEKEG